MKDFRISYFHDVFDPPVISNVTDTCTAPYFVYGCISNSGWEDYAVIKTKYPHLLVHRRLNEGDFYIFSRDSFPDLNEYYFTSEVDLTSDKPEWVNFKRANVKFPDQDLHTPVFCMDSSLEFSPTFRGPLRDICRHKNDIIDLSVEVETGIGFSEAFLQLCIYKKDELLSFQSRTINNENTGEFHTIYCSTRLADVEWRHHSLEVRGFIWNPKKQDLMIRKMTFSIRHGNPVLYGLYRATEE